MSGITADGGGDSPEDVMGGLSVAFSSLSWRSGGCRVNILCEPYGCGVRAVVLWLLC